MDIQRGDQVYYRGEMWTVSSAWMDEFGRHFVHLEGIYEGRETYLNGVSIDQVQRVEQVR